MFFASIYLLTVVTVLIAGLFQINYTQYLSTFPEIEAYVICAIVGGLAGCIYCLRALYLNKCVRKKWDADWIVWYYIRPVVSLLCGAISRLFLKAGLIILDAKTGTDPIHAGFWSLAFLAGYNCDKFLQRIESIGKMVFGIETSRASKIGTQPSTQQGSKGHEI